MQLSVSWLGVILISSLLIYFIWYGKNIYEEFANDDAIKEAIEDEDVLEGFATNASNPYLNITTCPAASKMYINKQGLSVCCDGAVNSDSCAGETICTLSESSSNMPTCTAWYEAYLKARGSGKCPSTMPNYYESANGQSKGCTSGYLNKDATAPHSNKDSFCNLYTAANDNYKDKNSCANQILLENTKCFSDANIQVTKALTLEFNAPPFVLCTYKGNMGTPSSCMDNDSVLATVRHIFNNNPNWGWKLNDWIGWVNTSDYWKLEFCSVAEKVKIKKTWGIEALARLEVYPNY